MDDISKNKPKKHICVGILAHVDAGKTTLSESMLYLSGSIRKLGRVDNKDAFLDTYELERARGITIFSKQAEFNIEDTLVTLLDTPGHVDFSAEMERTLQVLDYAILVISAADGVQGHTQTLWGLLKRYNIPTFIFINKMDQNGTDKKSIMDELTKRLDDKCIEFGAGSQDDEFFEQLAVCDEQLLEDFLENGTISHDKITEFISKRKIYPCYFGSALKLDGIEEFMKGFNYYTKNPCYSKEFGARVFKISRDEHGNRLTYMKITGAGLKVKDLLTNKRNNHKNPPKNEEIWEEKVNQIRIYNGEKYENHNQVNAGTVCAVTGLNNTYAGEGLGFENESKTPFLEPVLTYQIKLPDGCNVNDTLSKLHILEEEEPQLHIIWNEYLKEIQVQLMGEVQIDILKSLIMERFNLNVEFGTGNIVYKETIANKVEGVGHFEPLRHYAEVHLIMEPLKRGSGLVFESSCSEDTLDKNWQRLIMTHLEEKEHKGVLTGSPLTDMKITLAAGKAHVKHTEGGDFRQSTYRAVRQGLMQAENVLLEPYYNFRIEVPSNMIGRAMADVEKMYGSFEVPFTEGDMSILTGNAPAAEMIDYQNTLISYSRGIGRMSSSLKGYEPCHNQSEVIKQIGYEAHRDLDNPADSIFCIHGAGAVISWDKVKEYMHIESYIQNDTADVKKDIVTNDNRQKLVHSYEVYDEDELEEIFAKTYGADKYGRNLFNRNINNNYENDFEDNRKIKTKKWNGAITLKDKPEKTVENINKTQSKNTAKDQYLLVDGYNIIFAWDELKELADINMDAARNKLMDIMCNYQGFKKCILILVFDAYKVIGNIGQAIKYHNINVVYTKEAETADQYIEKTAHKIGRKYDVTVATSDGLEQLIIRGQGCKLLSAKDLHEDTERMSQHIREEYLNKNQKGKNYLLDYLDEKTAVEMEKIRLGTEKK